MDKLKVHIDSNLIKSTTTVPDELKDLGVQAYDEDEFEKGVLLQVDLQVAEYELNKIKDQMKKIGVDGNGNFLEEESSKKEQTKTNDIKESKKRKNEAYFNTFEQYKEKKLRLESKFEDLNNYMLHNEEDSNTTTASSSNSKDNENLIKSGEMTPFGTQLYFDKESNKPSTSKAASVVKTSSKQMKLTDFDKFSSSPGNNKKISKNPSISEKKKQNSIIIENSEPTDFEKFLGGVVQEPKKSKFNRISTIDSNINTASVVAAASIKPPLSASNSSITIKKIIIKENEVSDFDKFLNQAEGKVVTSIEKKKKEIKSKPVESKPIPKKEEKKVEKKFVNKNQEIKASDDVISFVKIFEEDENEQVNNVVDVDRETDKIISTVKRTLTVEDDSTNAESIDMIENDNDDGDEYMPDEEEIYDETDIIEDTNDMISSDVEYDSDSTDEIKNKKLRNCNDDGDEELFLKRLKKLDKLEKESQKDQTNDEPEYVEFDGGIRVPNRIWSKLYKFQKTGVKWLWELHNQRCGGILGDEMGLGKTIQTISFLASVKYSKMRSGGFDYIGLGPTLIICPTTLISQWVDEFRDWWPYFRVAVLHESGTFNETPKHKLINKIFKCNGILITTYSSLLIYEQNLIGYNWHYVILDEGHKIRNPDAKITIVSKCFRTPHRLILSGSPIQNNLKELWSLFDFIFPAKLGTLPSFLENFSIPIVRGGYSNATDIQVQAAYKCATILKDTITPYLLRRNKADVKIAIQLPEKNEQVLFCRLSDEQKDQYLRYIKSSECTEILNKKTNVFKALIYLRKLCNHSDLVIPNHYDDFVKANNNEKNSYGYFKRSGKMVVVEKLLKLWKKQENRVLLFTQSRQMLNIIEGFVISQNYEYLKMDGTTNVTSRSHYVKEFNTNSNIFIFILTTKVGGLGLNLIGANRVIIFDPDWNPSTDIQARERSWRIGQTKSVTIYRLLTAGTIEEKIYHRQIFKQFLTNKVLTDPKQKRFFKTNDLYELFSYTALEQNTTLESTSLFAGTNSEVKKPKVKYSKMDGERITGLVKSYDKTSKLPDDQQNESEIDKQKDDYVLNKLFKSHKSGKSAIHTALQHDMIVNNQDPDFALVETEAERVATDAIKSLKKSRKYCHSAESGKPNLTGIKFGQKSNLLAFSFNKNNNINNNSDSDDDRDVIKNNNNSMPLSSAALMECIKKNDDNINDDSSDDDDEDYTTSETNKFTKIADDLRNFVLYGASKIGQASTEEIVEHFKKKLDKKVSIKFKAILKKLCYFTRTAIGVGFWKLKDEFK